MSACLARSFSQVVLGRPLDLVPCMRTLMRPNVTPLDDRGNPVSLCYVCRTSVEVTTFFPVTCNIDAFFLVSFKFVVGYIKCHSPAR